MSTDVTSFTHPLTRSNPRRTRVVGMLAIVVLTTACGAAARGVDASQGSPPTLAALRNKADQLSRKFDAWYRRTPPMERVAWGGLAACALLGIGVIVERMARVRRSRIIPDSFVERFQRRLGEGGLDRGKGLDYCELNPSPAARVALAAIRRWGRSTVDLERGVGLARQVESDRLRRNLGTLRRVAAMAPLLGLLGTLAAAGRAALRHPAGPCLGTNSGRSVGTVDRGGCPGGRRPARLRWPDRPRRGAGRRSGTNRCRDDRCDRPGHTDRTSRSLSSRGKAHADDRNAGQSNGFTPAIACSWSTALGAGAPTPRGS